MNFITQKKSNECGAVAIINLFLKINHEKIILKDLAKLKKQLKIDKEGCEDKNLKNFLNKKGFINSSCNSILFSSFKRLLNSGKELIITVETPYYNHYSTVVGFNKKGVYLSNMMNWSELKKDKQPLSKLKPKVFYNFEIIKKICVKKGHDLSVIIIRTD